MLYDYLCRTCGSETEAINSIAERRTNAPVCCDEHMDIIIKQAPYGFVDREVYYQCPVTNQGVTSRRQRNEIMAREGLIDANDIVTPKTIAARKKKYDKIRDIAESHRAPDHVKREVESMVKREANI